MILLDVNVWLPVLRADHEQHTLVTRWLDGLVERGEEIGVSELALSGAVRILTHPGIFVPPSDPTAVLDACRRALEAPSARVVRAGARHWRIFDRLVREAAARGNDVPDAFHAALAIEHGATLASFDRGLARFAELRLVAPSA
ncbi:TA system VapC family ribonuclease toxin [Nocardioides sp.]|uniref:TA system VapC family ribonuclease toxin n=1 Tax=Nocardioides sp. TaxID=35761 RepID=UPI002BB2E30A|nr:TA system VapC family ribonuclease toxin [Nocardioides sp.]HSX67186.1 TA system VapC family ribonuclease toxin [Nocardioides sp.]